MLIFYFGGDTKSIPRLNVLMRVKSFVMCTSPSRCWINRVKSELQCFRFVCIFYGKNRICNIFLWKKKFPFYQDVEDMRKTSCGDVTPASYFSSLLVVQPTSGTFVSVGASFLWLRRTGLLLFDHAVWFHLTGKVITAVREVILSPEEWKLTLSAVLVLAEVRAIWSPFGWKTCCASHTGAVWILMLPSFMSSWGGPHASGGYGCALDRRWFLSLELAKHAPWHLPHIHLWVWCSLPGSQGSALLFSWSYFPHAPLPEFAASTNMLACNSREALCKEPPFSICSLRLLPPSQ